MILLFVYAPVNAQERIKHVKNLFWRQKFVI
jgi:hypothetical protein